MDGLVDGYIERWINRWMDRWMDGWMDAHTICARQAIRKLYLVENPMTFSELTIEITEQK